MSTGGFITLPNKAEADIDTAPTDYVNLFNDADASNTPAYKDDAGTVTSLKGADGTPGADAPPLTYLDHGNTGASEDIDFSAADVHRIVLNSGTVALSTSGWPASGTPGIVRVYVQQDGGGGRLLTYSAEINWGDPGEPTLQTTGGSVDVIDLQTIDGGTTVLASMPNRPGPTGAAGTAGVADDLTTSETDTTKRLAPDGAGGVAWGTGGSTFTEFCSVYGDAVSQTNGAEAAVACAHENYDPTGMHDNSTNPSRITIANTGYYHVAAQIAYAPNASGNRAIEIRVNGTNVRDVFELANQGSGFDSRPTIACDLYLTTGQYVELYAYQNSSGGTLNATVTYFDVSRFA